MGFSDAVSSFFLNYANFSGRARRSELWWVMLFLVLADIAIVTTSVFVGFETASVFLGIFHLIMVIPLISLWVRRLHDTDKEGIWLLLVFVPIVGWIFALIWALADSTPANRWGPPAAARGSY